MWPSRYFADRYWTPRYWPKVGATSVIASPEADAEFRLYEPGGSGTWIRKKLPQFWIGTVDFELLERGGFGSGSFDALASWADLQLDGDERFDIYLFGELVYRGYVRVAHNAISQTDERVTPTLYGLSEILNSYIVTRKYAYGCATDVADVASAIFGDYVDLADRLPNAVADFTTTGVTLYEFDARGRTVAQAFNQLCDLASASLIWGADVDGTNPLPLDRIYLRAKETDTVYRYTIGGSPEGTKKVSGFVYPRDIASIVNRVHLKGGPVQAGLENLITNGSFEEPARPTEQIGNRIIDWSFEDGTPSARWTLNGGATVKTVGSAGATGSPRTGTHWLELDTNGEKAESELIPVTDGNEYTFKVWYRKESTTCNTSVTIEADALDAGSIVLGTVTLGANVQPEDTIYEPLQIDIDTALFTGTVSFIRVRMQAFSGTASDDGVLFDDPSLFEKCSAGQKGWRLNLEGAADLVDIDWMHDGVEAKHGGWCVRMEVSGIGGGSDYMEIYQSKDDYVRVNGSERYTFAIWWRSAGTTSTVEVGVEEYDSGYGSNGQTTHQEVANPTTDWRLLEVNIDTEADTQYLQPFIRLYTNTAIYVDACGVWQGDVPHDVATEDCYWPGDTFEGVIDTERTIAGARVYSLGTAIGDSVSDFGYREAEESSESVTDWDSFEAYSEGYFPTKAIPEVRASLSVIGASEVMKPDGKVRLLNLPSNTPAALFPARVRYVISPERGISFDAELGSAVPDMADLLRLTEARARSGR